MHFAIDHRERGSATDEESPAEPKAESSEAASKTLLRSIPVRWQGSKPDENRVAVEFRDVLKLTDRWLIRYALVNRSTESYPLHKPRIALMNSPISKLSLLPLSGVQLGPREASHVRSDGQQRLDATQAETEADFVAPGREAIGVVGIAPLAQTAKPSVLQFEFPADRHGRISGMLVL